MNRIILRIGAVAVGIAVLFPPCRHSDRTGYGADRETVTSTGMDFLLGVGDIAVPQYVAQVIAVAFAFLALSWAFATRKQPRASDRSTPPRLRD